jgi:sugar diacid utilization regulator
VASLRQLVGTPALAPLLSYVTRPATDPAVERVALIEDFQDLRRVGEHAIVLLTRGESREAGSYRFDMALRLARSRRTAALVLSGADAAAITATSASVADRSGTAILGTPAGGDLGELAIAIARELSGGADVALLRAHTAVRAIAAHPAGGSPEGLVERAGAALGIPLRIVAAEPASGPLAPILVEDRIEAWIAAPRQEGDLAAGLEIVLHAAAAAAGQLLAAGRRAEEAPVQSRGEVLSELLSSPAADRPPLVRRARSLGFPIDGWHVGVRLDFEHLADAPARDALAAHQTRSRLAAATLHAVRRAGGDWHSARSGQTVVLMRTYAEDPGSAAAAAVARSMDDALGVIRSRLPGALVHCGVGSAHQGPPGLVTTVAEAKAAATAARAAGRRDGAVAFDTVGLRRTLVEWYASETAQEAVTSVLAPLTRLGGARSERLLHTLHVYLDQRGSLTRTAETLNMHRNAVAYRINQVFELLEIDRDNPDDLLLLQLACRARELA